MKKILITLFAAAFLLAPVFSQEMDDSSFDDVFETTDEASEDGGETSRKKIISTIKLGGNASANIPIGALSEFVGFGFGGGVDFELGIPIPLLSKSPIGGAIFQNFAVGAEVNFNYHLSKVDFLNSMMNVQVSATALTLIPLGKTGFSLAPEIGIGMAINFPMESSTLELPKKGYIDQVYSAGLGVRFSHKKLARKKLELSVTPTYIISPEQNAIVQYVTVKIGALGRLK